MIALRQCVHTPVQKFVPNRVRALLRGAAEEPTITVLPIVREITAWYIARLHSAYYFRYGKESAEREVRKSLCGSVCRIEKRTRTDRYIV